MNCKKMFMENLKQAPNLDIQSFRHKRLLKQQRLNALQQIRAGELTDFLDNERNSHATNIQSAWRGYAVRKKNKERFESLKRDKAAKIIQRSVRKWQEEKLKILQPNELSLSGERIVQLEREIDSWQKNYQDRNLTVEEQKSLHCKAQLKLAQLRLKARIHDHNNRLQNLCLVQLESDAKLLMDMVPLKEVDEKTIATYRSFSRPIIEKAKTAHEAKLHQLEKPWLNNFSEDLETSVTGSL